MGRLLGKIALVLGMVVLLVLLAGGLTPGLAETYDTYWTGTDGPWDVFFNWLPRVPDANTSACIDNGGIARIVSADAAARDLAVGYTALGTGRVELLGHNNLSVGDPSTTGLGYYMNLGHDGMGEFFQENGAVTVNGDLTLGYNSGGKGEYYLADGSLTVGHPNYNAYMTMGRYGVGSFTQDSGSVTANAYFRLGIFPGSKGYYYLREKGTLTVGDYTNSKSMMVADRGTGEFHHDGGVVMVSGPLSVGYGKGSEGYYYFNGGSLTVGPNDTGGYQMYVGHTGEGEFHQSGGEVLANGPLIVGAQAGSNGAYYLTNDGTLTVGQENLPKIMTLGSSGGTGLFQQTGGEVTVTGTLNLGLTSGAVGNYMLEDGTLTVGQQMYVGSNGIGGFQQNGGEVTVNEDLVLGYNYGPEGVYTLAGGTTTVYGGIDVGVGGTFTQTGGTFAAASGRNRGQMIFDGSSGVPLSATIGDMTNEGTVKVTSTTVTFTNYTENGSYTSDPASTIILADLTVESDGYFIGGTGDDWQIGNNFYNTSTQSTNWQTSQATLVFVTGTGEGPLGDQQHDLQIPGEDMGPSNAGYKNNFAWGTLLLGEIDESGNIIPGTEQTINLFDGSGTDGGALYAGLVIGADLNEVDLIVNNILNSHSYTMNIYYNPLLKDNKYLGGLTYDFLIGNGQLIPTPIPGSVLLLSSGLLGLGLLGWRKKRG